ncbi:RNA ligase family protein [Deinococcus cellulosilyticus]|uniref:2'-5' RNA ligase n=1 Tax=Deinococcus cellulosilyticus (strain DSM 18568 / NBRC 106333 / KACC 11606 / 5516J-15) TaxID=1223518 RepID=A0A511MXV9_DEIC1|nr:RNA ligase family protein [Deinococcus cellulosilyticus]GEM45422.1 2'-5' RNA ligase [Deinococcus cellulosilyticus NBRC 106333 = KACC 11606]
MHYTKYPRTPHLPWSQKADADDVILPDTRIWEGMEVVITEKLDGENTSLYRDYLHARSVDNRYHPSRDWIKRYHGQIRHLIPEGYRICGENMYAQHSIVYHDLESYFYVFSVWDEKNCALGWDETLEWAAEIGAPTPRELYRGLWDEQKVQNIEIDTTTTEGYVVRPARSFPYSDFGSLVGKWVRANHVQTSEHWMHQAVIPNGLRKT